MKKILLINLFTFSLLCAHAQSKVSNAINNTTKNVTTSINSTAKNVTTTVKKQAFGVKLGYNLSNTSNGFAITTDPAFTDPKMKGGLLLGIYSQFQMSSTMRLQPELFYSAEGSMIDGKLGANNTIVNVFQNNINYLNLPLMLQYTKGYGFYAEAGPQIGFRLSAKYTNKNPSVSGNNNEVTYDVKSKTKGTAFGFGFGAGYELKNGLGIGARYMLGLTNIHKVEPSVKSNVLSISLQYRFKGKD